MSVRKRLVIEVEWEGACSERYWAPFIRKAIEVERDGSDTNCRVTRISGTTYGETKVQAPAESAAALASIEASIQIYETHQAAFERTHAPANIREPDCGWICL